MRVQTGPLRITNYNLKVSYLWDGTGGGGCWILIQSLNLVNIKDEVSYISGEWGNLDFDPQFTILSTIMFVFGGGGSNDFNPLVPTFISTKLLNSKHQLVSCTTCSGNQRKKTHQPSAGCRNNQIREK